ncbi:uncharacterized protein A1O9_09728 [Exophiala aquamarina CBS 119918]|uniref:Folliculin-interacting protein N-terminal domain-containing protein n=1 Tax=Exophiala aquamarina CBS 119918 TaxID=1182545 RepID=A0A072P3S4_9EURO|nr:uncharacterized protein A1O9_09728 [Exophiala aquamarina CBS 119918]KEF53933.1 hypothetical protein A1O9_09728 [Exophiala aquamarina CBS 119918]
MLGRLIQGYSRSSQLESATDETHTRTLLWPEFQSPDGRPASSVSPPTTPFGSPTLRVSPFDDKAGLELNETKDLRLIIAQDAFGTNDRPLLLFDSQSSDPPAGAPESVSNNRSNTSPLTSALGPRAEPGIPINGHIRNRSSTISGASASWIRSSKESDSTDHLGNILDCMFGVSSATKTESSTKMHLLPGDQNANGDLGPRTHSHVSGGPTMRAPFLRAKTATHTIQTQRQHVTVKDSDTEYRDAILITRVFAITLPDAQEDIRQHRTSSADNSDGARPTLQAQDQHELPGSYLKKPKIVEKKTPVFAIGLLCYLPNGEVRPGTSNARPSSRASFTPSGTPNSYGSESMSSWTFLNAIPEHLMSSESSGALTDKGVDVIVKNWDVILRSLGVVEKMARADIAQFLQQVNLAIISSVAKAPKGPSEQRTNQRNVYLRTPNILSQITPLNRLVKQTLWRVCYAFRVPRVLTGFGLENGGHWLDEARYLVRISGNKPQNFFLFNLLTAFLGSHTEWLERLGPDWYRRQFKAMNRGKSRPSNLASRTVIVCDNRSTARRFIFLLASFLPRSHALNFLARTGPDFVSPLLTPDVVSTSPAIKPMYEGSIRRHVHGKSRDSGLTFPRRDVNGLSTSVSSNESLGGIGKAIRNSSRSNHVREDLQEGLDKPPSLFAASDGFNQGQKTVATSSTATPSASTPVPHFASKSDSYFPENVIADEEESGASADLARILRRDSSSYSTNNQTSIKWGSLISNVSGLWYRKSDSAVQENERLSPPAARDSLRDRRSLAPRSVPIQPRHHSPLKTMVDEVGDLQAQQTTRKDDRSSIATRRLSGANDVPAPNLTVDDRDGVVDVDINLPGFIGWADPKGLSIPTSSHHRSPSVLSDEIGSSYSSRSALPDSIGTKTIRVGGYLRRYHEDFSLQGVKPYAELQDEVRQSMSRELTPIGDVRNPLLEETTVHGGQWVNVCTTLLADLRTFTIQRLTLRRKVGHHDGPLPEKGCPEAHRRASQVSINDNVEDFVVETVMDFDTTLTDAIERVLTETEQPAVKSVTPSRTHSRTVSTGTTDSLKSGPLEISGPGKTRDWGRPSILSQSDCRQVVVGALEEVVRSVNDDLTKNHRDTSGKVDLNGKAMKQVTKQDNVLREGVKKWLLNVETRSVW